MNEEQFEIWLGKWRASDKPLNDFLALANANGLSFSDTLKLHRWLLIEKGREYVKTWGPNDGTAPMSHDYDLRDGAYYVLGYIEDEEWENPYFA